MAKPHRLPGTSYLGTAIHFLTLCFANRRTFAKNPAVATWLIERLRHHAAARNFLIHAYCVMHDHVHLLAEGATPTSNLIQFITAFKQQTGFDFKKRTSKKLWQLNFYDHVLRNSEDAESVAWYIWLNPVRKALPLKPSQQSGSRPSESDSGGPDAICKSASDYPFSGSMTESGLQLFNSHHPIDWTHPGSTHKIRDLHTRHAGPT